ncbi:hypothetical protein MSPP1_003561 [Malassezia sp. CBS 17886]|nr:hypothetical protein MSPP1_003561 [Malassezia sp. CBS 17886]
MPCSICLEGFAADRRPAALPCGHIFHAACVRDWLESRAHGTVAAILPLWPDDANDFNQYVAAHRAGATAGDPQADMLRAACSFVFSMQGYVMAAHGLRSLPARRAHADMAAQKRTGEAEQAWEARVERVERDEHAAAERAKDAEHLRRTWRQKHKELAHARDALAEKRAALRAREKTLAREHDERLAQMQAASAAAKTASVDAIRRAALQSAEAAETVKQAEAHAKNADERVADAQAALEAIQRKNQAMAGQMRALQEAVRTARKRRHVRGESPAAGSGTELRHTGTPQRRARGRSAYAPRRGNATGWSSPTDENMGDDVEMRLSSRSTPHFSRLVSPHCLQHKSDRSDSDLDDTQYPMPGGVPTEHRRSADGDTRSSVLTARQDVANGSDSRVRTGPLFPRADASLERARGTGPQRRVPMARGG